MKNTIFTAVVILLFGYPQNNGTQNKDYPKVTLKKEKRTEEIVFGPDSTNLTKELLVKFVLSEKIAHPEVAYAIARQESNLCSNLFKKNKNLFGMRQPGVRPTLSIGRKSGFASFKKWQHSVLDYKLYLEFVGGHTMTREQYLAHLDRSYAHHGYSNYIRLHFQEFELIAKSLKV
jgi:hypothetical protein